MKKIKEPNLKVIKFESMDVIATSTGDTSMVRKLSVESATYVGTEWYKSN